MTRREAPTPSDLLKKVLRAAGPDLVLVGGQALAFWMDHFDIDLPFPYAFISADIDFLAGSAGDKAQVVRMAKVLGGEAVMPHEKALTALVGQAIKPLDETRYYNIDVVFRLYGANEELVRNAALEVGDGDVLFRVMHPMDVLKSRLDNLYGLPEKQLPPRLRLSELQLTVAILVAQRFQSDVASKLATGSASRATTLPFIKFIGKLARGDAGKKIAHRHGIFVADAIEPSAVSEAAFHERRLPQLLPLMSPDRRRHLGFDG